MDVSDCFDEVAAATQIMAAQLNASSAAISLASEQLEIAIRHDLARLDARDLRAYETLIDSGVMGHYDAMVWLDRVRQFRRH